MYCRGSNLWKNKMCNNSNTRYKKEELEVYIVVRLLNYMWFDIVFKGKLW